MSERAKPIELFQAIQSLAGPAMDAIIQPPREIDFYRLTAKNQQQAEELVKKVLADKRFKQLIPLSINNDFYVVGGRTKGALLRELENSKNYVAGLLKDNAHFGRIFFSGSNNDKRKLQITTRKEQVATIAEILKSINGGTKVFTNKKSVEITGLAETALRKIINTRMDAVKKQPAKKDEEEKIRQHIKHLLLAEANLSCAVKTGRKSFLISPKHYREVAAAKEIMEKNGFTLYGRLVTPGKGSFSVIPTELKREAILNMPLTKSATPPKVDIPQKIAGIVKEITDLTMHYTSIIKKMEGDHQKALEEASIPPKGYILVKVTDKKVTLTNGMEIPVDLFPKG